MDIIDFNKKHMHLIGIVLTAIGVCIFFACAILQARTHQDMRWLGFIGFIFVAIGLYDLYMNFQKSIEKTSKKTAETIAKRLSDKELLKAHDQIKKTLTIGTPILIILVIIAATIFNIPWAVLTIAIVIFGTAMATYLNSYNNEIKKRKLK